MKKLILLLLVLFLALSPACGTGGGTQSEISSPPVSAVSETPRSSGGTEAAATPSSLPEPENSAEVPYQSAGSTAAALSPTPVPVKPSPSPGTPTPQASASPEAAPSPTALPEPKEDEVAVKAVGPDGLIFAALVPAKECKTVLDALLYACDENGVEVRYAGKGSLAYIQAIGGYAEKDEGPLSGWLFKVNGALATKGAGQTEVGGGDRVSFYYSKDFGKDIADKD